LRPEPELYPDPDEDEDEDDSSLLLPLRRFGSSFHFSERPMFWPKLASLSLFDWRPLRDSVSRFTLPAEVEVLLWLSLSRSRLSIVPPFVPRGDGSATVIRSAMEMPVIVLLQSEND
jgi:hypothetical protein